MLRKSASRSFRFSFAIKTEQNKTSFNMLFIIFKLLEKKPSLKYLQTFAVQNGHSEQAAKFIDLQVFCCWIKSS